MLSRVPKLPHLGRNSNGWEMLAGTYSPEPTVNLRSTLNFKPWNLDPLITLFTSRKRASVKTLERGCCSVKHLLLSSFFVTHPLGPSFDPQWSNGKPDSGTSRQLLAVATAPPVHIPSYPHDFFVAALHCSLLTSTFMRLHYC